MRLRETVRLPERLHQDHVCLPLSQKPLRKPKNDPKPRFSEFNPNLPPAAFPTLNSPRAEDNERNQTNDDRTTARKSLEAICQLTNPGDQKDAAARDELEDMPMNVLENHMASNGEMNPIYVSNMAKMAAVGQELSAADGMEDSDADEAMAGSSESSTADSRSPTWADLSRRMQTEIFSNLLERHTWSKVNHMLGLTEEECETNEDLLCRRSQQIRFEDAELSAMRAKQLKDLLKLDNSAQSRDYPYLLLFRKASRQTFSIVRRAMETGFDFLCCEGTELTAARKFLRARGIDAKFAGDWGNDIVLVQADEEEGSVHEAIELSSSPILLSEDAELSTAQDKPTITLPNVQGALLRWFGSSAEGAKVTYARSNGDPNSTKQFLTLCFKNPVGYDNIHGRKRKREDQGQPQRDETLSAPATSFYLRPPPLHHYVSASVGERLARLHGATHRANSASCFPLTENNTNRLNPEPGSSPQEPSSFFLEVISEIITARNGNTTYTPEHRARLPESSTANYGSEFMGLVKTPVFIGLSPSPAPSRADSDELFEFSNLGSPETDATSPETSTTASVSMSLAECETFPSRSGSSGVYDGSWLDEGDNVIPGDEMVLLSTELKSAC
ncbi:hypothetical protein BJX68DRAFT_272266 [Aspergillus pseudodeflectus]|uniref:Uncharacterized protein n=1 Tax=Aspergillus pseudodeflectus TaxID=176178 RepID=A0ABR4JHU5_9EURO